MKGRQPDLSPEGIILLRSKTEKMSSLFGKLPKEIVIHPEPVNDMYAEWVSTTASPKKKAILYFHGGGYVIGSPPSHRVHVSKAVKGSGFNAYVFDYRLAPEHPFPAALEDALCANDHLINLGYNPGNLVFMGDSAGAGLLLATLLALKDKGEPLPAGTIALSPWTDLNCTAPSLISNINRDPMTWEGSCKIFSRYYCGDQDPENPWVSPLYGNLDRLPPLLIFAGNDEVLRDDAIRFAEKAREAGTEVTLRVGMGMFHCYPVMSPLFPEAKEAMQEICDFIAEKLNGGNGSIRR